MVEGFVDYLWSSYCLFQVCFHINASIAILFELPEGLSGLIQGVRGRSPELARLIGLFPLSTLDIQPSYI